MANEEIARLWDGLDWFERKEFVRPLYRPSNFNPSLLEYLYRNWQGVDARAKRRLAPRLIATLQASKP